MPNWCIGELSITGKKEELAKFKKHSLTKNKYPNDKDENDCILDTENFVPFPKEYYKEKFINKKMENMTKEEKKNEEMLAEIESRKPFNQLDWCRNNWGTKWGICYPQIATETVRKLVYEFQTAWTPCLPVINAMSIIFPNLKFNYKYWEGGVGFKGQLVMKNKIVIKNEESNYGGGKGG